MTDIPTVRSLSTPEGLADPYAIHERFRQAERAGLDIGPVVVSYDQVTAALGDRSLSSERVDGILGRLDDDQRTACPFVERTLTDIIAFRDPPDHTRLRRLLAATFTPKMVAHQRTTIERLAASMVESIADDGEADLFDRVTFPLPAMMVGAMLGVPEADLERFQAWALDIVFIVGSGNPTPELAQRANDHFQEMREYFGHLLAVRREHPTDDLLSAMIAASDDDDRLSEDEIYANATFLMTAGHETATNMLTNGILALLDHPDQLALLGERPDLLPAACDEILRYESPVQMTPRYALSDGEVLGRQLHAGDAVMLFLGAANRDPARFERPNDFDIARPNFKHVAFGHGAHYCLGASLARHELAAVLSAVFGRLPGLELAIERSEIDWQPTRDFRGPRALPVRWTPAGRS